MKHFLSIAALTLLAQPLWSQSTKTIKVLDATIKDAVVADAYVFIQKNGEKSGIGKTDANGEMQAAGILQNDENTLLIIQKEGYSTLVVKCPCWGYTYALSPTMQDDKDIRVVLSWGAQPLDLDIHATFGNQKHVFYAHKEEENTVLDVDDQNSYGPETITITNGMKTDFNFFVRDYTNRQNRNQVLSRSNATVFVYKGNNLIKTYYVPTNQTANLWSVFTMRPNGEIIDHNEMTYVTEVQNEDNNRAADAARAAAEEARAYADNAVTYLSEGENAYRNRQYEQSLKLYQKALNNQPDVDRAIVYNNMALSYLKLNKFQNVVLYSEKSIQANPQSSGQTLAASYYNMGLANEKLKKYKDAAQNFQKAANAHSNNTVYLNALKRVRKQIK